MILPPRPWRDHLLGHSLHREEKALDIYRIDAAITFTRDFHDRSEIE